MTAPRVQITVGDVDALTLPEVCDVLAVAARSCEVESPQAGRFTVRTSWENVGTAENMLRELSRRLKEASQ